MPEKNPDHYLSLSYAENNAIKRTDELLKDSGILDWLVKNHGGLYTKVYIELRETAISMYTNFYLAEQLRRRKIHLVDRRNALAMKIGKQKAFLKPWEIKSKWIVYEYEISFSTAGKDESNENSTSVSSTEIIVQEENITRRKKPFDKRSYEYSSSYKSGKIRHLVNIYCLTLLSAIILIFEYLLKIGLSFITILSLIRLTNQMQIQQLDDNWRLIIAVFSGISLIQYVSWYVYNEFFYNYRDRKAICKGISDMDVERDNANPAPRKNCFHACRKMIPSGEQFSRISILILIYLSETLLGYEGLIALLPETVEGKRILDWSGHISLFLAAGSFVLINILYSIAKSRKVRDLERKQSVILELIEGYKLTLVSINENMGLINLYEERFLSYKEDFDSLLYAEGGIYDLINLLSIDVYGRPVKESFTGSRIQQNEHQEE